MCQTICWAWTIALILRACCFGHTKAFCLDSVGLRKHFRLGSARSFIAYGVTLFNAHGTMPASNWWPCRGDHDICFISDCAGSCISPPSGSTMSRICLSQDEHTHPVQLEWFQVQHKDTLHIFASTALTNCRSEQPPPVLVLLEHRDSHTAMSANQALTWWGHGHRILTQSPSEVSTVTL